MISVVSGKSETSFDEELALLLKGLYLAGLDVGLADVARLIAVFRHAEGWSHDRKIRALLALLARTESDAQAIRRLAPWLFLEALPAQPESHTEPEDFAAEVSTPAEPKGGVGSSINRSSLTSRALSLKRMVWVVFILVCLCLQHSMPHIGAFRISGSDLGEGTHRISPTDPAFETLDGSEVEQGPIASEPLWKPCPVQSRPPAPMEPTRPDWLLSVLYSIAGLWILLTGLVARRHRLRAERWRRNLIRVKDSAGARSFYFDTHETPESLEPRALQEAAFQISAPKAWSKAAWIDPDGTVDATLENVGQLTLRFGKVREHRPCLFIEDVSASMAPWVGYGEQLVEAIRGQGLDVFRVFMSGSPGFLSKETTLEDPQPLEDVIRHLDQPVVVVLSACDGIVKDDSVNWLSFLEGAFWLHPRQPETWDETSRWLNRRLALISLDEESLQAFKRRRENRLSELPWRPPRLTQENPKQVVASLRTVLNLSTFDALTVAAALCFAGKPTVRVLRRVLEKLEIQSSTRSFDRIWSLPCFSILPDGAIRMPSSVVDELLRQARSSNPKLLNRAVSATVALLGSVGESAKEISHAEVQLQALRGRLLVLASGNRREGEKALQKLVDEGFGQWVQEDGRLVSEWGVRLSWRRPRPGLWLSMMLISFSLVFSTWALLDSTRSVEDGAHDKPQLELLNMSQGSETLGADRSRACSFL